MARHTRESAAHPQRVASIDLLRVLGIIAVVATHAFALTPTRRLLLFTWQVPLFFLLSGYFFRFDRAFGKDIETRARTLLVPYASWMVVVAVFNYGYQKTHQVPVTWDYLLSLVKGGHYIGAPFSAFWFFTALFFVRLYARALASVRPWLLGVGAAVALVLSVLIPEWLGDLWWAAGVAVPMLVFLAAGIAVRWAGTWIDDMQAAVWLKALAGAVMFVAGVVCYVVWPIPMDIKYADFGTPVVGIVGSCLLCGGLVLLFSAFTFWSAVVSTLAQAGVPVLFIHPTLILWLRDYVDSGMIRFVITVVVSFAIGLLINRSAKAKLLFG
ncbi:acyltransferase family protein [Bifidobacterium parmae]|nr:acyltransferase [Bifidobacterium parmae]